MLPHIVNNVCKSAFYHLRTILRMRKYLSTQTIEIVIHAFVTSKIDHCNSLLHNVPKNVIKKLQAVQNAAARLITRSRKCDHITPIVLDLHWVPVSEGIKFKILLLTFKALHQQSQTYIQDLITRYLLSRLLRSSSTLCLNAVGFNLKFILILIFYFIKRLDLLLDRRNINVLLITRVSAVHVFLVKGSLVKG